MVTGLLRSVARSSFRYTPGVEAIYLDAAIFRCGGRLCCGAHAALRTQQRSWTRWQPHGRPPRHSSRAACISPESFLAFPIEFFLSSRVGLAMDRFERGRVYPGDGGGDFFMAPISRSARSAIAVLVGGNPACSSGSWRIYVRARGLGPRQTHVSGLGSYLSYSRDAPDRSEISRKGICHI